MKRLRCPKCDYTLVFDETRYQPGQRLVFTCPACGKEFAIRLTSPKASDDAPASDDCGSITVIENRFCHKQIIPLKMGDNVIGRKSRGGTINCPIETDDPSVDLTHCVINVSRNKNGKLQYVLRDGPSNTGTGAFRYMTVRRLRKPSEPHAKNISTARAKEARKDLQMRQSVAIMP